MEDLFLPTEQLFDKVAAETELAEDPSGWPQEILQELFKQLPYIAEFEPHITMDRVDGERGYGFGHVEVSSKTEVPTSNPSGRAQAGVQSVRLPIIINGRKLSPFDILVTHDSKMLPLTESRLRQLLFRPQLFDVTAKTPGDQSLIGQLFPPYRQNYGLGGGGGTVTTGMGKTSSLLQTVLPSARRVDLHKVASEFTDELVQANFVLHKYANHNALRTLFSAQTEKVASAHTPAEVFQLQHIPAKGYAVKLANRADWDPKEMLLDRGQAVTAFGLKTVLAADTSPGVIASDVAEPAPSVELESAEADRPELIKDYGLYKVQTEDGKELVGYVFPNLLDLDGRALPIALFTNGSQAVVQGEIAGVRAGEGQSLPTGRPRGHGCFYRVLPNGKAEATIPLEVQASFAADGNAVFSANTYDGRGVEVHANQPNIEAIQLVDGAVLVPQSYSWLPLDSAEEVSLVSDPEGVAKEAALHSWANSVQLSYAGSDEVCLEGLPLAKLGADQTQFISYLDAQFLMAGLGVHPQTTLQKIAQSAISHAPVSVTVTKQLGAQGQTKEAESSKLASAWEELNIPPVLLVKEAAVIPDPMAVDTVLSVGFISPENVRMFLEALPLLDKSQEKLCELLIASRLGLREVPAQALESAIRGVETVIEGLKVLAFSQN